MIMKIDAIVREEKFEDVKNAMEPFADILDRVLQGK